MTLSYKGIKLNYNITGKGNPLIFLHGFLENLTMWDHITPDLSNNHACITIDLLGHGKTDCIGYIHSMEDMAEAIHAITQELKLKNIILIGHSMGGYAALAYLDLFPDTVSGLLLLNSTSFSDSEERKINRSRAIDIVKKNPNAYTSMAIANLFAEENRIKYTKEIEHIKNQASNTSTQGIISALEGMKIRKDRSSILSNFTGSKTIFSGILDPVLPHQQNIKESITCATNLTAFNGGHMTYIENKSEFIKSLQLFLASY